MMKSCTECLHACDYAISGACLSCFDQDKWLPRPKVEVPSITNADHIRSMSDEELATMLRRGFCGFVQTTSGSYCKDSITCTGCIERWLKQPYKEKEA